MKQLHRLGLATTIAGLALAGPAPAQEGISQIYEIEFFAERSHLLAINETSDAVGFLQFFDATVRTPHVFSNGRATPLSVPDFLGVAAGLNASGAMVGWDLPASGGSRALRWADPGSAAEFLTGLGPSSMARAINDSGVITGWTDSGNRRAFRWTDGSVELLETLGGTTSEGHAINAAGDVVGTATDASGEAHAVIWIGDTVTQLAGFGSGSAALDQNEAGVIVGTGTERGGATRPVRWDAEKAESLGTLHGYNRGEAWAVDASGDVVVGHVWEASNPEVTETAFIHRDGAMVPLRTLVANGPPMVDTNLRLIRAYDVNSKGEVVGVAWYGGLRFGFILRPIIVSYEYEMVEIPAPTGAIDVYAHGLNDSGEVVGHGSVDFQEDPPYPAWRWSAEGGVQWLPNLDPVASFSAEDINEDGRIVGSPPWEFGSAAWSLEDGVYQEMELPPGTTWAFLTDINVHGAAAGFADDYSPEVNSEQFFVWNGPGALTLIPEVPAAIATMGRMNDQGAVTGTTRFGEAFRWAPGDTELELLPSLPPLGNSAGRDINNAGQICGSIGPTSPPFIARAALHTDGIGWEEIADLGLLSDVAVAMNDQEVVIGSTSFAGTVPRAWVWTRSSGARFLDELIDPALGSTVDLSSPVDINEAGQILIQGYSNGERRAFLLTPGELDDVLPGDVNNDQTVDVLDLILLLARWGPCEHAVCAGDFDGNGTIGTGDLLIVLANWSVG